MDKFLHINIPDINVGEKIEILIKELRISQSALADLLNIPKTNVFRFLHKNTIDTSLLQEICVVLEHNFFKDLAGEDSKVYGYVWRPTDIHIGINIGERLDALRMSQKDLAIKLGVSQPAVSNMLGNSSIDTGKLANISRVLGYNFFKDFYRDFDENGNLINSHNFVVEQRREPSSEFLDLLQRNEQLVVENDKLKRENEELKAENMRLTSLLRK